MTTTSGKAATNFTNIVVEDELEVNGRSVGKQAFISFTDDGTVTVYESVGITSIVRLPTGTYTITFSSAFRSGDSFAISAMANVGSDSTQGCFTERSSTLPTSTTVYKTQDGSVAQVVPMKGVSDDIVKLAHSNEILIKVSKDELPSPKLSEAWEFDEKDKVVVNIEKGKVILHECEEVHASQAEIDACKTEQDLLNAIDKQ